MTESITIPTHNNRASTDATINYEITENTAILNTIEDGSKNEIDVLLNDDDFFSGFDSEFDLSDDEYDDDYDDDNEDGGDNIIAQHVDYFENYKLKQLYRISDYYQIPRRKLKKEDLIAAIVQFENDHVNIKIVYNRKRLWHYLNELKSDAYCEQFVDFD